MLFLQISKGLSGILNEICDFDKLIDEVIEQIKHDINVSEDFTAIDELLRTVPVINLINYLPETIQQGK